MIGDLTTLAKVKIYLQIAASELSQDARLTQLISSQSGQFKSAVRRDILYRRYVETRDGNGNPGIEPRQYPLQSVESIVVDGNTIPAQPLTVAGSAPQYGFVFANDRIEIAGGVGDRLPFAFEEEPLGGIIWGFDDAGIAAPARFSRGRANVVLTYWAGFLVSGEQGTIDPSAHTVQAQDNFYSDVGVTRSDATTALTRVSSAPAVGQYTVSVTGLYAFNASDSGDVLLTYAVVPTDIEQAVHKMISREYRSMPHEGQRSAQMGNAGGTVYYDTAAYSGSVEETIDKYLRRSI